jgi:hypothetical protein
MSENRAHPSSLFLFSQAFVIHNLACVSLPFFVANLVYICDKSYSKIQFIKRVNQYVKERLYLKLIPYSSKA